MTNLGNSFCQASCLSDAFQLLAIWIGYISEACLQQSDLMWSKTRAIALRSVLSTADTRDGPRRRPVLLVVLKCMALLTMAMLN